MDQQSNQTVQDSSCLLCKISFVLGIFSIVVSVIQEIWSVVSSYMFLSGSNFPFHKYQIVMFVLTAIAALAIFAGLLVLNKDKRRGLWGIIGGAVYIVSTYGWSFLFFLLRLAF